MTERILSRREAGADALAHDREAFRARRPFVNQTPHSEADAETLRRRTRSNRYLFKPRDEGGREVWDVFELRGARAPKFVMGGFWCREEAIARIGDLFTGRETVSFAGVRELFRAPKAGSVLVPDRSIALGGNLPVQDLPGGGGIVGARPTSTR